MASKRLVLVDDDPLFRSLLAEMAEASGAPASAQAASLKEARKALATGADIILLDLHLPDAEGAELVRTVRALSQAHIVVLTGDDSVDAQSMLDAGADCVTRKGDLDLHTFPQVLSGECVAEQV